MNKTYIYFLLLALTFLSIKENDIILINTALAEEEKGKSVDVACIEAESSARRDLESRIQRYCTGKPEDTKVSKNLVKIPLPAKCGSTIQLSDDTSCSLYSSEGKSSTERCEDRYEKYTDKVKQSDDDRKKDQLDRADKIQDLEEKIADEQTNYNDRKSDLQEALSQAQQDLETKLLEIENEKTNLDVESQEELDALLEEYREGASEVQKLLTTERQKVMDGYQTTVKSLSRECRNNAQKLVSDLVAQRNAQVQARAKGIVPAKKLGGNFAAASDTSKIQRLVNQDFKECQSAKTDIEAEANRTLNELNNNAQSTQERLKQVEKKVQQTSQKVEQLSQQLAKKAQIAQNNFYSTAQRIQQQLSNLDQEFVQKNSMYQQRLAQLNSEAITGNATLLPGLRNNAQAGFDFTSALQSGLVDVCCTFGKDKNGKQSRRGTSVLPGNGTLSSICKRPPRASGSARGGR